MRNVYRCYFIGLSNDYGGKNRAKVTMIDDHKVMGGRAGELNITSTVLSLDLANGVIVTKNSVYVFEPEA